MKRLALFVWNDHRDKVLYLVVGFWNTVFSYGVFALCWWLLSDDLHPDVILVISYGIASINGFIGFRYIVFKPTAHPLGEYVRYQMVYAPLLLLNLIVLPLCLEHTSLNAYVIQALFGVFCVVAGYVGNKYFAFRKVKGDATAD